MKKRAVYRELVLFKIKLSGASDSTRLVMLQISMVQKFMTDIKIR